MFSISRIFYYFLVALFILIALSGGFILITAKTVNVALIGFLIAWFFGHFLKGFLGISKKQHRKRGV